MTTNPGCQQQPSEHDKGWKHTGIFLTKWCYSPVAFGPSLFKFSDDWLVLEEAHCSGKVITKPTKATIVKVNNPQKLLYNSPK